MQGRNGDENVENGLTDTVGEGESSSSGKSSINIYTLSCVKWITGEKLLCNTERSLVLCDGIGREALEGKDVFIITADSNHMVETNTTL